MSTDHAPGAEVARLALPMPVTALVNLTKALERAYGKGLRLKPAGRHYLILMPTAEEAELDRKHRAHLRQSKREREQTT